jgi:hypothetical protein
MYIIACIREKKKTQHINKCNNTIIEKREPTCMKCKCNCIFFLKTQNVVEVFSGLKATLEKSFSLFYHLPKG